MRITRCSQVVRRAKSWTAPFKSKEIRYLTLEVTPDDAENLISHRRNNRDSISANVHKLTRDMLSGYFDPTLPGVLIMFDQKGRLADGLHRLRAQVNAEVTITWNVVLGLSEAQIQKVDSGATRTLAARLQAFVSSKLLDEIVEGKGWKARQAAAIVGFLYNAFVSEKARGHLDDQQCWLGPGPPTGSLSCRCSPRLRVG